MSTSSYLGNLIRISDITQLTKSACIIDETEPLRIEHLKRLP